MTSEKRNFEGEAAFHRWKPAAWLRVFGADAATFLQGQFSNDLRRLESEPAVYGLWLNHKGRVIADSFVLRGLASDEFWIGSYRSAAATIRERLEAFVIADDVAIEDVTAQWAAVTLFGALAAERLLTPETGARTFPGRRGVTGAVEWIFPAAAAAQAENGYGGAPELSVPEMERRRIEGRVPAVPMDLGPGDLPNEGGLETEAISYTKGCYLGQEVMARLKSMGQVRRRLLRVRSRGPMPPLPAAVHQGERKMGELRSAVRDGDGWIGLALLSLVNLPAGGLLSFSPNMAGGIALIDRP